MHFSSFFLTLLAATALASPLERCPKSCDGQHSPCNYCKDGNTLIGMTAQRTNWGTVSPHGLIEEMKEKCNTGLINCKVTRHTDVIIGENDYEPGSITLTIPDTSFINSQHELNQLIEGMRAAVVARTRVVDRTFEDDEGHVYTLKQHFAPKKFIIQRSNGNNVGTKLSFHVDIDFENDGSLCSDLLTGASAIAGSINGVAGGVFSLASLECD